MENRHKSLSFSLSLKNVTDCASAAAGIYEM